MAQTLFVAPPAFPTNIPSSPDPTPLRLLAFSVAEAALQSNPSSPALCSDAQGVQHGDWVSPWAQPTARLPLTAKRSVSAGGSRRLWDVVEHAKERRVKGRVPSPQSVSRSASPPTVLNAYNFTLPPHSPLASSVAAYQARKVPARDVHTPPPRQQTYPLYTRSAEPSPTKNVFHSPDGNRVPGPRLSANEFAKKDAGNRLHPQRQSTDPAPSRHVSRLPSLAQIQAKLHKAGHRRRGSTGDCSTPMMPKIERTTSNESIELLQTPTGESPAARPRIVCGDSPDRCPPTPPSPSPHKDARLTSFLRQRTSGRLAEAMSRPVSTPTADDAMVFSFPGSRQEGPTFTVTPPTLERKRPAALSPLRPTFTFSTPPSRTSPLNSSPDSPTESMGSSSTNSPTLSVPIITCTPAPVRLMRNGVELDSDEDEVDFVLFEADAEVESGDIERVERERRGKEMLERLMLRQQSE